MHNGSGAIVPDVNASSIVHHDYLEEWEGLGYSEAQNRLTMVVLAIVIFVGSFSNLSSIIVVVRRRLWKINEGYIHLLAILVGNLVIIVVVRFPHWLSFFRLSYHVGLTTNAVCKVWHFLAYAVFSTGWYVVALLLRVLLRDRLTRGGGGGLAGGLGGSGSCRGRLAVRYCSLTGSKVVVAVISGSIAVMDVWQFYSVELMEYNIDGKHIGKFCEVSHGWYSFLYVWEYLALCTIWILPTLVLIPALLVAILWTRRCTFSGGDGGLTGGGGGFSFRQMTDEGGEPTADDDGEFARAALLIGLTVFLLESSIVIVSICLMFAYHDDVAAAYGVVHTVATTHVVVVPVLCLATIARMRKVVQSAACAGNCCPGLNCCGGDEEDVNGILQLDSLAQLEAANSSVKIEEK